MLVTAVNCVANSMGGRSKHTKLFPRSIFRHEDEMHASHQASGLPENTLSARINYGDN